MVKTNWSSRNRPFLIFVSIVTAASLVLTFTFIRAIPASAASGGISLSDWESKSCQNCHPQQWNEWSRSGHAMTLSAQLLNTAHNSEEQLDQTCVKCHSAELGTVDIGQIVQPLDMTGPWKLVGQYANSGDTPAIPCLECHQPHGPKPSGLLPGMDFGDESSFYRNVPAPQVTNLFIFDAFAQKHVDPQPIAPVMNGPQAVPIPDTLTNRVCYTCHATDMAASNLFEPNTPPSGDNSIGTGDDRTLTGVHQGIPCVTCHMPNGSHTFNPMSACGQCHNQGTTVTLDFATRAHTSFNDPALSMLSGNMSPLNIHWLNPFFLAKTQVGESGSAWSGSHTTQVADALQAKLAQYQNQSLVKQAVLGIDKGSLFLRGSDNQFYEFAIGERGAYHIVDGQMQRALIMRDLANGQIQLDSADQNFFTLPEDTLAVLEQTPIAGEAGSDAPTFQQMRSLLTISGAENYDQDMRGLPALKTIDKSGSIGTASGVPWLFITVYENGHNLPQGTIDFLNRTYGAKALETIGLPISDPFWMKLVINGQPSWILCQAFERGTITYNPQNPVATQYEGGLIGNMLVSLLNSGDENLPGDNNTPLVPR
jgi:hypothetical protein